MDVLTWYRQIIERNAPSEQFVAGLADSVLAESTSLADSNCREADWSDQVSAIPRSCGSADERRGLGCASWPRAVAAAVIVLGIGLLSIGGIGERFMAEAEAGRYAVTVNGAEVVDPETIWFDSDGETVRITADVKVAVRNPQHEEAAIAFEPGVEVSPAGRKQDTGWQATLDLGTVDTEFTLGMRVTLPAGGSETDVLFGFGGDEQMEATALALELFMQQLCDCECTLLVDGEPAAAIRFVRDSENLYKVFAEDSPICEKGP